MKKQLLFILLLLPFFSEAALNGTYTINGGAAASATNYQTFASAISDLNGGTRADGGTVNGPGISASVIFNVVAGHTENANDLILTATGTAGNTITFQKNGAGVNPKITANAGATPASGACLNSILWLYGSDYIILDGIDFFDAPGDGLNAENAITFAKPSMLDGCQHNIIRNCTISLVDASSCYLITGIASLNINIATPTSALDTANAFSGTSSFNEFYSNTISNVQCGINLQSSVRLMDQGNEIGVSGANTITCNNILAKASGVSADDRATSFGISYEYQDDFEIANNILTVGANVNGPVDGILNFRNYTNYNASIHHNTINLNSASGNTSVGGVNISCYGINATGLTTSAAIGTPTFGTLNINNNIIQGLDWTNAWGGFFYAIQANAHRAFTVNVFDNIIRNNRKTRLAGASTSAFMGMAFNGALNYNIYGNEFTNNWHGVGGEMRGLSFQTLAVTGVASIHDNIFSNNTSESTFISFTGASFSAIYLFGQSTPGARADVFDNVILENESSNLALTGIFTWNISNLNISGNDIRANRSIANAIGINATNTLGAGTSNTNISKNKIVDLAAGGTAQGIVVDNDATISNNMICDFNQFNATGILGVTGIQMNSGNQNAYYNSIYLNTTTSGSQLNTSGISVSSAITSTELANNLVVNTSTAAGTGYTLGINWQMTAANLATKFTNVSGTNNNSYFVGASANSNIAAIGSGAVTYYSTLAAYQTATGVREDVSLSLNPTFFSATDLHSTDASLIGAGVLIGSITDDFDGTTRGCPEIGFDEFDICGIPLPINLTAFTGKNQGVANVLEWTTATEINNDYFTIEASANGISFDAIGTVKGVGNSTQTISYSLSDRNPHQLTYYRLKQTDLSGDYTYSQTIAIAIQGVDIVNIYPNPSSNYFQYIISSSEDSEAKIKVIDALGRVALENTIAVAQGLNTNKLDISGISSGIYSFQVTVIKGSYKAQKQFSVK